MLLVADPPPAHATDTWSDPFPGVRHLHRQTSTPWNIHALLVDLCAPGVSVRATAPSERGQTVSSFGISRDAEAAINGDFFIFSTYQPSGLAIGNSVRWSGTSDPSWEGFVAFGDGRADLSNMTDVVSSPPGWMDQVVSGRPQVVRNGAVVMQYNCSASGNYRVRDPRAGVGLSQDRRTLISSS